MEMIRLYHNNLHTKWLHHLAVPFDPLLSLCVLRRWILLENVEAVICQKASFSLSFSIRDSW